jgi:hypothetical protein
MHGLWTLIQLNREFDQPELSGRRLRHHPRIAQLRTDVALLPVAEDYRRWLYRSLNLYAEQIVARPQGGSGERWDDLEALQQVTLGDMMERALCERSSGQGC